ncbi:glycerate 2-kinase [Geothermobacter ehrlichii]|uniref:Glycerate 2-kinase n=1 Tax=Geothermobacter ehrlichii TaxID=213224 RepID=A0A5D3WIW4_9BACT|nr:DUF4147 domain-containing protein [Geothermobacter ehrlichii]TYO98829.1 glycerate 2-kinase [Geothermobacter ehrlichii]
MTDRTHRTPETKLRQDAETIFWQALAVVDPARCIERAVRIENDRLLIRGSSHPLPAGRLQVLAVGKGALPMATAIRSLLGPRLDAGLLITKDGHGGAVEGFATFEAAHPVPDGRGEAAARRALRMAATAGRDDLLLLLLSGGGSALLPLPATGLGLADKMAVTDLLLRSGADIGEINSVRKHLSAIKGGRLALAARPARLLTLAISDVPGDDPATIASGPGVPDPTTFAGAMAVLEKYRLTDRVPAAVRDHLQQGMAGKIPETPKPGDLPDGCACHILANNRQALRAAAEAAHRLGYEPLILERPLSGEAATAGRELARQALAARATGRRCLIAGGETTVSVRGNGKGGRNQELALGAAIEMAGESGMVLLAAGTDGTDGPTDAAGAIVDGTSLERGRKAGLLATATLTANDSYRFHQASGDLLITGPTGTNVMDLALLLTA